MRIAAFFRRRTGKYLLIATAILVGLYALLGFVVLPRYLHPQLEQAFSAALRREATVEKLYFNPFAFSTALRNVRIVQGPGKAGDPLFTAEEIYANVSFGPLLRGVPVLESVRIVRPHLRLRRNEDRRYNIQDLIDEWRNRPESDPALFTLNDLEVKDGAIDFDDDYTKEQHRITALNIGIPFLSNLPQEAEVKVQPSLSALINGAPLLIQGETQPFNDTQETTLRMRLDKLQLAKYVDYLPLRLHFHVAAGAIDGELQLKLSTAQGQLKALKLSGTASMQGLELQQLSGDRILAVPSMQLALEAYDLMRNELLISHLTMDQPSMQLTRYKDGRFNFVALSAAPVQTPSARVESPARSAPSTAAPPRPPFRFHLRQSEVRQGSLQYRDLYNAKIYQAALKNVGIKLANIGTGQSGTWQAAFDSDAGEAAAGEGKIALAPLQAEGDLKLRAVQIKRFLPLYADKTRLEIRDGLLDGQTHFEYTGGDRGKFRFTALQAALRNGQLGMTGERDALFLFPQLDVRDATVDFGERRLEMGELRALKGKGRIVRLKEGGLQLASPSQTKAAPQDPTKPWHTTIGRLAIQGFALDYEDRASVQPVKVSATAIDFTAEKFGSEGTAPVSLKAMINKTGTLSLSGPLGINPLRGTLDAEARGIDLVQFEPYWRDRVNFDLKRGVIGTRGQFNFNPGQGESAIAFKGNVRLANVHAADRASDGDLLRWRSLFLRNVNFQSAPFKAAIERITLSDFYSRLVLQADGKLNVQSLRVPSSPTEADATPSAPVPEAPKRVVQIGGIELREGRVSFADFFVKPNYSAELNKVAGTVSEISPGKPGQVDIRAALNNSAPVNIEGLINPLSKELFLDLHASARGVDLPTLSPYTIKYAGYGIERGKLSFRVHYVLENRQLSAENQLTLDQLVFGERAGEQGPNLPVHLAVALLKDRNGVINLNLPISGSLDDPQFSLGGLIGRMFVNLVLKVVTSPFALIGSMFGGGESGELSYVEFEAGESRLDDGDKEKLDKLAAALRERPALRLDIAGYADPSRDREGLQRLGLLQLMKAQKATETGARNLDEVEIAAHERDKYLALAYKASDVAKPRNFIGIPKDIPPAEMEKLLLAAIKVDEEQLRSLANARAHAAREWLVSRDAPGDRIYLVASSLDTSELKDGAPTRVEFTLR
ncbi:MAG TPA: DUF748 domain-containing protein [Burkholderiales bacterium]|nr:DUF748 domain-containing protein [Burkholderiales bacterium]